MKKGGVYAVQWLDHFAVADGGPWVNILDVENSGKMMCITYGVLVFEDALHYAIASTRGDTEHPERGVVSDVTKILKSAVVGARKLL